MVRSLIGNMALLFATLKGTSNGKPKEGNRGLNDGSVGHGGPQKV